MLDSQLNKAGIIHFCHIIYDYAPRKSIRGQGHHAGRDSRQLASVLRQ
ncbi:hypothetical protein GCM10009109_05420 [Marinobacterium sediminicola]